MRNSRIKKKIIPGKIVREIVEFLGIHDGRRKIPTTIKARNEYFI